MTLIVLSLLLLSETFGFILVILWMLREWHKEIHNLHDARLRDALLTPPDVFTSPSTRPDALPVSEDKSVMGGSGIPDIMSSVERFREYVEAQQRATSRPEDMSNVV